MAATLDSLALMTAEEFRRRARIRKFEIPQQEDAIDAINEASAIIRKEVSRRLLFLGTDYVEFHDIFHGESVLWLRERPVITITEVAEDSDRTYGAGTVLTDGTDFVVDNNRGTLTRISGSAIVRWEPGIRTVRVTYSGGYDDQAADKANVPHELKYVCSNVALRIYRENDRAMQGVSSKSGPEGSTTRFDARKLSEQELDILSPYRVRGPQTYITDEVVA